MSADDVFTIDFSELNDADPGVGKKTNLKKSLFIQRFQSSEKKDNVAFPEVSNIISTESEDIKLFDENVISDIATGQRDLKNIKESKIKEMLNELYQSVKPEHLDYLMQKVRSKVDHKKQSTLDITDKEKRKWMEPVVIAEKPKGTVLEGGKYRFDFDGNILSYIDKDKRVVINKPSHIDDEQALLHHGEDPNVPGYTIDELFHLSKSYIPAQRVSALKTIGNIIRRAKRCQYYILKHENDFQFVNSIILSHVLHEGSLIAFLRHLIDSNNKNTMVCAILVLYEIIVSDCDEKTFSIVRHLWKGYEAYPLSPSLFKETNSENEESDIEILNKNIVEGLLEMQIIQRFRYVLEVLKPDDTVVDMILKIITRLARSSRESATKISGCDRLCICLYEIIQNHNQSNTKLLSLRAVHALCQSSKIASKRFINSGLADLLLPIITPTTSSADALELNELALGIWEICLRYGLLLDYTINYLDTFIQWIVKPNPILKFHGNRFKSNIIRLFECLIELSQLQEEGESLPKFRCNWETTSPLLQYPLITLKSEDLNPCDKFSYRLVASSFHFISAFIERIFEINGFDLEEEEQVVKKLAHTVIIPFFQGNWFRSLLTKCLDPDFWSHESLLNDISNIGDYCVSLVNHPALSWKSQCGKEESKKDCITLSVILNSLLSILRIIDIIGQIDSQFIAILNALEITESLVGIIDRYIGFTMNFSSTKPALYVSRIVHLTCFYLIKILYHGSSIAHEAALICLGCLLPNDADFARYLLKRTINFTSTLDLREKQTSSYSLESFYLRLIEETQSHIIYDPVEKSSLIISFECNILPFTKIWPYLPILQYKDMIHSDLEDKSIGVQFVYDSLTFIKNLESSSRGYTSKVKRSIKLKTIMSCFLVGPDAYTHKNISEIIEELFDQYLLKGWEPLNLSCRLESAFMENLVRVWSNEAFGDSVLGKIMVCWSLSGASISPEEHDYIKQKAELKSLEQCLWSEMANLWHTLPPTPDKLLDYWHAPGMRRKSLIPYYIKCLKSPHARKSTYQSSFYLKVFIENIKTYIQEASKFEVKVIEKYIVTHGVADIIEVQTTNDTFTSNI